MDTPKAGDAARIASELHPEIILVPFMAKFVVCGRRHLPTEARLRVFCMTGDVLERTIRNQGKFAELARSREVEVSIQVQALSEHYVWQKDILGR